jgi:hypothetical protein
LKKLLMGLICFLVLLSVPIYSYAKTGNSIGNTYSTISGWKSKNGNWYYYTSGKVFKGWLGINGKWYYLDKNGVMKTGWVKEAGKWYYLDTSGEMRTGWIKDAGKWYYFDGSGEMKTGWLTYGGKWYFLDTNGAMKTGWALMKGKWYFLDNSGDMKTGWLTLGPDSYYLNADGSMKTGWFYYQGEWYFLNKNNGRMFIGWERVDGKVYFFTKEGLLTHKFVDGRLIDDNGVLVADTNDIAAKYGVIVNYTYTGHDMDLLLSQNYNLISGRGEYIGIINGGLVEGEREYDSLLKELALGIRAPVSETELNVLVNQAYANGEVYTNKIHINADGSTLSIKWEF